MKRRTIRLIVLFFLTLNFAFAQTLSVQGVIRGSDNRAISDATYYLTFFIYNVETGGSSLWTEEHTVVVTN
ncbi:hypothetical protein ACFL5M_07225, partial [Candidatus Neomarinimicrobiota bacterium]